MAADALNLKAIAYRWTGDGTWSLEINDLTLPKGGRLFIGGPSGSGKSTLLNLLGGLLVPERGSIEVLGQSLSDLSGAARDRFRADNIGFMFQMFNLVPYLNVLENVLLPCRFSDQRFETAAKYGDPADEAARLIAHMGLDPERYADRPVTALSVGQQQRVAAARALIGAPALVIADEPTSALDAEAQAGFLDLLAQETDRNRTALVLVSHDQRLADNFPNQFNLPAPDHAQGDRENAA